MKTSIPVVAILLVLCWLAPDTGFAQIPTAGLVAYYPFTGNANDASGNGKNGTIVGSLTQTTDRNGNSGQAYLFNGSNSKITVSNWNTLTASSARSISLWFKTSGYPTANQCFLSWGSGAPSQQSYLGTSVSGGVRYLGFFGYNSDISVSDQSQYYDNRWHHIVFTFDGSLMKLFIDGVFLNSGSRTLNTSSSTLSIGSPVTGGDFFNGSLDEVRIYNTALSDADVRQVYLAETPATIATNDVIKVGAERFIFANGNGNTFVGLRASAFTSGIGNTFFGQDSGPGTSGGSNTFIGSYSGQNTLSGANNVFLGYKAGIANTAGSFNLFLGSNTAGFGTNAATLQRATAIGYNAKVSINDAIVLGDTANTALAVGIGTTAPKNRLEVRSSTSNTSGIRLTNLTANSTTLVSNGKVLSVDPNGDIILVPGTGSGSANTHSDSIWVRAATSTYYSGTGNVGIGTNAPGNRLEVRTISPNTSGLRFTNLTSGSPVSTRIGKLLSVNALGDVILVPETYSDSVWTRNATNTYYSGNGNVGIGTNTPANRLEIRSSLTNASGLRLTNLTSNSPTVTRASKLLSVNTTGDLILVPAAYSDSLWSRTAGNTFYSGTGNIGIGTTNPLSKLEISSGFPNTSGIRTTNLTAGSPTIAGNGKVLTVNNSGDFILVPDGGTGTGTTTHSDSVWVRAATSTYYSGTGNVGIGTSTPAYKLQVNGDINIPAINNFRLGGDILIKGVTANYGNLIMGFNAGNAITETVSQSGIYNTILGNNSGRFNSTGNRNTFVGQATGFNNTTGSFNTYLGRGAGLANQTGSYNTLVGLEAGGGVTASNNTMIGYWAGTNTSTGQNNTLLGTKAGISITTGNDNVLLGYNTRVGDGAGNHNIAIGSEAGGGSWSGTDNTLIGYQSNAGPGNLVNATAIGANARVAISNALILGDSVGVSVGIGTTRPANRLEVRSFSANTSGLRFTNLNANSPTVAASGKVLSVNTLGDVILVPDQVGSGGGSSVWTGDATNAYYSGNVGIGTSTPAYKLDVNGDVNIASSKDIRMDGYPFIKGIPYSTNANVVIGFNSGSLGEQNVVMGNAAGSPSSTGGGNIFIGSYSGDINQSGQSNTFVGLYTGRFNTSGLSNVFLGNTAGFMNSSGSYNTFVGEYAGQGNTIGFHNTMIGDRAGYSNSSGSLNTIVGTEAGNQMTGSSNTMFGYQAGKGTTTGRNNTFVGYQAGATNTTGNNNIIIGPTSNTNVITGNDNILMGYNSRIGDGNGLHNVIIGGESGGGDWVGGSNTLIGYRASAESPKLENATAIGADARVTLSNAVVLGNQANVGIGTSAPVARLHVVSDKPNDAGVRFERLTASSPVVTSTSSFLTVNERGDVVLGSQSARSLRLQTASVKQWPDYVFARSYSLMPLDELGEYVRQHHRLPGFPSAQEMTQTGASVESLIVNMVKMQEEQVQYMIQLKAENDQLRKENQEIIRLVKKILREK